MSDGRRPTELAEAIVLKRVTVMRVFSFRPGDCLKPGWQASLRPFAFSVRIAGCGVGLPRLHFRIFIQRFENLLPEFLEIVFCETRHGMFPQLCSAHAPSLA
jgi:hypothetical protein